MSTPEAQGPEPQDAHSYSYRESFWGRVRGDLTRLLRRDRGRPEQ